MLAKSPYLSHLVDFIIREVPARDCEPLPALTALPLIFAMSLLLWSMVALTARALV
jgi:hypothetical protein